MNVQRIRNIAKILSRCGMYLSDFVLVLQLIDRARGHNSGKHLRTKSKRVSYWELPARKE